MPHEVKGRKRIIEFIVDKLYRGNLLESKNEFIILRRNFLATKPNRKERLDYKSSYALEDYFNAILRSEPLPSHKLQRETLDKLLKATPGIRGALDEFLHLPYFFEEDFEPELFNPIRKEAILNRFDNVLDAMRFLIKRCPDKEDAKGVIMGALMSYQIVQTDRAGDSFRKIVTSKSSISWEILIQDPSSEIIDSVCNVTDIEKDVFEDIESYILETISKLEEALAPHGGRIKIQKQRNILEPSIQGVFLGELCATLPSGVELYDKDTPKLDLRMLRHCHSSFTKKILGS